jgi:acetyltransferase-like isoleucine patch superfamily enzyme
VGAPLITTVNEARHRAQFRAWTAYLSAQLRRRGAQLVLDAPHGARMTGFPRVHIAALGDGGASTLTLKVGRGVRLGPDLFLDIWAQGTNHLQLDDGVMVGHGVRIQLRHGHISVGAHTDLRDGVMLKSEGELLIGRDVTISYNGAYHCMERIEIGNDCGFAENVSMLDLDHHHDGSDFPFLDQGLRTAPVIIGSNTMIGSSTTVLRGARVGKNSVIGAGAVVLAGDYPDSSLLAGAPARAVKPLGATGSRLR